MMVWFARAQPTILRSVSTGSTAPVGLDGEFSQSRLTWPVVAANGLSVRISCAPASRAPTSYVGYASSGIATVSLLPSPSWNGRPETASLEPIVGITATGSSPLHLVGAGQPPRVRLAQREGALGRRVAREVAAVGERAAHRPRNPVHRRADGQVDQPVRMCGGPLLQIAQLVPRIGGQPGFPADAHGQFSAIGGSAATIGSSRWILPTRDAPPGEPSSSKKSTFAR